MHALSACSGCYSYQIRRVTYLHRVVPGKARAKLTAARTQGDCEESWSSRLRKSSPREGEACHFRVSKLSVCSPEPLEVGLWRDLPNPSQAVANIRFRTRTKL